MWKDNRDLNAFYDYLGRLPTSIVIFLHKRAVPFKTEGTALFSYGLFMNIGQPLYAADLELYIMTWLKGFHPLGHGLGPAHHCIPFSKPIPYSDHIHRFVPLWLRNEPPDPPLRVKRSMALKTR